jgi:hypothetical protein
MRITPALVELAKLNGQPIIVMPNSTRGKL